jgi:2-keto-4-pentenoate hydratase/2-oxohepta-3-ene-1,7-dioic acid hydratase in catechol pathway
VAGATGPGFALGRFTAGGEPFAGMVVDQQVVKLDTAAAAYGRAAAIGSLADLFPDWDANVAWLSELAGRLGDGSAGLPPDAVLPMDLVRATAPVQPAQVLQAGANYRTHVIEIIASRRQPGESEQAARQRAAALMDARAAEGVPYVFAGLPTSICGPYDDVVLPRDGDEHDWELELAAVIGRPAWRVSRAEALSVVAGYTIVNDITTRDRVHRADLPEIGTDWFWGKNAPTFLPTGPYLVPAEFAGDPMKLQITLRLNGIVMQDASTADMIFDVARLIEYVTARVELLPGDLLLTGSPAGNGASYGRYLRPGDIMEGEISSLGVQRNRCVAEAGN